MKKICFIRILKALALLSALAAVVLFAQEYLFYFEDHSTQRLRDFYHEPSDSLDVVVLGASDVTNGYSAGYAYDYSGLTSYPYTSDANNATLYLSQLKEILSRQNPQMIVVEVHGFLYDDDRMDDEVALRRYAENIPMSANKLDAILRYPYEDPISCLIPFFKYHGQWTTDVSELRAKWQARFCAEDRPNVLKGVSNSSTLSFELPTYDVSMDDSTTDLSPQAHRALIEFLEYCRSHTYDHILFVRFPHKISDEVRYQRYQRSNRIEEIVGEYGFDFLDFEQNSVDWGIDPEYDFSDGDHLNIYGQMKMTEWLCDILLDEYGLTPMEQTPENQQRWDETPSYFYAFCDVMEKRMEVGVKERLYETPELLEEMAQYLE